MGKTDDIWNRRDGECASGVTMISPPSPHAGIGRALRSSFDQLASLPSEWQRLLDRMPRS